MAFLTEILLFFISYVLFISRYIQNVKLRKSNIDIYILEVHIIQKYIYFLCIFVFTFIFSYI